MLSARARAINELEPLAECLLCYVHGAIDVLRIASLREVKAEIVALSNGGGAMLTLPVDAARRFYTLPYVSAFNNRSQAQYEHDKIQVQQAT